MSGPEKTAVVVQNFERLYFPTRPDLTTDEGFRDFLQALNEILVRIQRNALQNVNAVKKTLASDLTNDVTYFVAATSGGAVTTPLRFNNGVNVSVPYVPPANAPPNNDATATIGNPDTGQPGRIYP